MMLWQKLLLTCPCEGTSFTLHGVYLYRHPRRFIRSRMAGASDYVTCNSCGKQFGASTYMMIDDRGQEDPWARTLTREGKTPRWVQKAKDRRIEQIKVELETRTRK